MGFFKSFFSGKPDNPMAEQEKTRQKNFDIFKYDGIRAQRMGRQDYAIKCFTEALALHDDFETRGHLVRSYIQVNQLDEARQQLERMTQLEPTHTDTWLTLANVCYMQEDYAAMAEAAQKAIALEEGNAMAHYLLAKADNGQGDGLMCIAHLTQAITLKEDFTEARLLRAEALAHMQQYKEALDDVEAITLLDEAIELNPDSPTLYHERGRAKLLNGDKEGSIEDLKKELELNPKEAERLNGEFDNKPLVQQTDVLGL